MFVNSLSWSDRNHASIHSPMASRMFNPLNHGEIRSRAYEKVVLIGSSPSPLQGDRGPRRLKRLQRKGSHWIQHAVAQMVQVVGRRGGPRHLGGPVPNASRRSMTVLLLGVRKLDNPIGFGFPLHWHSSDEWATHERWSQRSKPRNHRTKRLPNVPKFPNLSIVRAASKVEPRSTRSKSPPQSTISSCGQTSYFRTALAKPRTKRAPTFTQFKRRFHVQESTSSSRCRCRSHWHGRPHDFEGHGGT